MPATNIGDIQSRASLSMSGKENSKAVVHSSPANTQAEPTLDPRRRPSEDVSHARPPPIQAPLNSNIENSESQPQLPSKSPTQPSYQYNSQQAAKMEELERVLLSTDLDKVLRDFKEYFAIDWGKMLPPGQIQDKTSDIPVFVQYPKDLPKGLENERKLLISFLQKVRAKRYDSDQPGDWQNFSTHMTSGILLVSYRAFC